MRLVLGLMLCCLVTPPVLAQAQRYVTDTFTVTVRSGKGNEYQILRSITSGTPVEVLQQTDDGYSYVRLRDGTQGWLLTRFLTDEPVAREKLSAAQDRLGSLSTQNAQLRDQLASLQDEHATLQQKAQTLEKARDQLAKENAKLQDLAQKPVQLQAQNQALQRKMDDLQRRLRLLDEQNAALKDTSRRNWFLAGGGVLLGGILLGAIFGRMQLRRRDTLFRS